MFDLITHVWQADDEVCWQFDISTISSVLDSGILLCHWTPYTPFKIVLPFKRTKQSHSLKSMNILFCLCIALSHTELSETLNKQLLLSTSTDNTTNNGFTAGLFWRINSIKCGMLKISSPSFDLVYFYTALLKEIVAYSIGQNAKMQYWRKWIVNEKKTS